MTVYPVSEHEIHDQAAAIQNGHLIIVTKEIIIIIIIYFICNALFIQKNLRVPYEICCAFGRVQT